ncbi:MAG: NFACT family protein [Candidatus Micrarchaeota archaeon]|nr:NFACT family protein [Candidatus Micrarchaeota archaeon]
MLCQHLAMQKMSSSDLHFAISEMKGLEGKRIARIRRTEDGIFLIKAGGEEILFQPGVRLHLSRQSFQAQQSPDGFVAFLRKRFEGKTVASIAQHDADRIAEIETKSGERLVFELFRKGNLIALSPDGTIEAALGKDEAGGRKIARGEKYCYPKATAFQIRIPAKPNFGVKCDAEGRPVSYSAEAEASDLAFGSFSEMADFYYSRQDRQSQAQALSAELLGKLERRLESQQRALEEISRKRSEAKQAADAIYLNFAKVEEILSLVRRMKKEGKSQQQINEELSRFGARLSGGEVEVEL